MISHLSLVDVLKLCKFVLEAFLPLAIFTLSLYCRGLGRGNSVGGSSSPWSGCRGSSALALGGRGVCCRRRAAQSCVLCPCAGEAHPRVCCLGQVWGWLGNEGLGYLPTPIYLCIILPHLPRSYVDPLLLKFLCPPTVENPLNFFCCALVL